MYRAFMTRDKKTNQNLTVYVVLTVAFRPESTTVLLSSGCVWARIWLYHTETFLFSLRFSASRGQLQCPVAVTLCGRAPGRSGEGCVSDGAAGRSVPQSGQQRLCFTTPPEHWYDCSTREHTKNKTCC